ncbi:hypothetical protein ACM66B_003250 [Microbotryomycetes sp. NB124-2]
MSLDDGAHPPALKIRTLDSSTNAPLFDDRLTTEPTAATTNTTSSDSSISMFNPSSLSSSASSSFFSTSPLLPRARSGSTWSLSSSMSSTSTPSSPSSTYRGDSATSIKLEQAMALAPPLMSTSLNCDVAEQRSLSPKTMHAPSECEQALHRCRQELREQMAQACQGLFPSARFDRLERAFISEFASERLPVSASAAPGSPTTDFGSPTTPRKTNL